MTETRQHKIDRIYEVMSDKTLSFWCKVIRGKDIEWIIVDDLWWWHYRIKFDATTSSVWRNSAMDKVIWHPVMIWDVLDWYNKVFGVDLFFDRIPDEIIDLFWDRKQKRKPLEAQSDDTIDYLYSLLPTEDDLKRK